MLYLAKTLLDCAKTNGFAIPAFSVSGLDMAMAVLEVANSKRAPVILRVQPQDNALVMLKAISALAEQFFVPVAVQYDAGRDKYACFDALYDGASYVRYDGTGAGEKMHELRTASVARAAQKKGALVEARIFSDEEVREQMRQPHDLEDSDEFRHPSDVLPDPSYAAEFVRRTGVQAIEARFVADGLYKFVHPAVIDQSVFDGLRELASYLPNTHIVLHGGSLLPEGIIAAIRDHGGDIPMAFGIPQEAVSEAVDAGVSQVNVRTDLHLALVAGVRISIMEERKKYNFSRIIAPAVRLMKEVCEMHFTLCGSVGKAALAIDAA